MKWLQIDFAEIEGFQVLVIIDIHSKWIEAIPLCNAAATTKVQELKFFSQVLVYRDKLLVIIGLSSQQSLSKCFVSRMESNIVAHPFIILPLIGQQSVQ